MSLPSRGKALRSSMALWLLSRRMNRTHINTGALRVCRQRAEAYRLVEHTRTTLTLGCLPPNGPSSILETSSFCPSLSQPGIMLLRDPACFRYSFERLRDIKTELDPYNVFRWPQSM